MVKYAGFWLRCIAYVIDATLLGLVTAGFSVLLFLMNFPTALTQVFFIALAWLYYALMESSSQQGTVGKIAVGLRVTNESDGAVSFTQATGRYFAKFLSIAILFIGLIMIAFTQRKQGLHDILAKTLVVRKY